MIEKIDVTDPAAAAVFNNPRQRKIVLALIERERSLTQLARLTSTPLNLLHHHMSKFLHLGLVEITRRESRPGAPVKFYRAKAKGFFVPAELTPGRSSGDMSSQLRAALDRSQAGALKGVIYSRGETGPRMTLVENTKHHRRAAAIWLDLPLNDADAATLADELRDLLKRFEQRSTGRGRRYLVYAAIASS